MLTLPQLQDVIGAIPSHHLLLESHAPYLSPDLWKVKKHAELVASLKKFATVTVPSHDIHEHKGDVCHYCRTTTTSHHSITLPFGKWECVYFNGPSTPFSNFFSCQIHYMEQNYISTEQIYQWIKAVDTGNTTIVLQIHKMTDPFQ